MKIYKLEDGEYSDYRVIGIFTTKENAKKVQKIVGGEIVEDKTDPDIYQINKGLFRYRVAMLRDGTTKSIELNDLQREVGSPEKISIIRRSKYWPPGMPDDILMPADILNAIIWAKDEQHAIKIVNEKRIQLIANNEWL